MLLSLDSEIHSLLMEFSKETGTPATSFVVELLETTKPQIRAIIEMVKLAKQNAPRDATNILREMAVDAVSRIGQLENDLDDFDGKNQGGSEEKLS